AIVERVFAIVKKYKPLHLSIVGGEPLVRFRELNVLLPELIRSGLAVQVVTSAVREIPREWSEIENLYLVVSIDGLQPEHDARRKPATYERIMRNIAGQQITVHCTVTSQMTAREDYLEEFLSIWSGKSEVKKVWFSLFTPQIGATDQEILDPETRAFVIDQIQTLKQKYPKLDMPQVVLEGYRN